MGAYFETNRQYIQKFGDVFQVVGYLAGPRLKGAASSDDTPTEKENPKVKDMSPEEKRAYDVKQLQHKKSQLKSKMYANEWEYTIVLSQCKKHDPASQWDNFKRQFAGIKYLAIPVKKQEGFIIAAVVSRVAKEKMENAKNCLCMVYPFESGHREKLIDILQNVDGKSYFCSRGLAETPKREYAWKLQTDQWDSVRGYCAVANFSTMEEAEYFLREGKRMAVDEFERFKKKVLNPTKVYKNISLYLSIDKTKIQFSRDRVKNPFGNGGAEVFCAETPSGYLLKQTVNGEDFDFNTFPCLYIITEKETAEVYYSGLSYEPIKRYCDHFGLNEYKPPLKNGSQFYNYVQDNNRDFSEFDIVFIPMDKYVTQIGEVKNYCPVRHKNYKVDPEVKENSNNLELELAEAYLHSLLLDMGDKGIIKVFKYNGYPLFAGPDPHNTRENRVKAYKEKYPTEDPVYTCLKRAEKEYWSLEKLRHYIKEREYNYYFKDENVSVETLKLLEEKFELENLFIENNDFF